MQPTAESFKRTCNLWLLRTAAYGIVNVNEKWQHMSDIVFTVHGIT